MKKNKKKFDWNRTIILLMIPAFAAIIIFVNNWANEWAASHAPPFVQKLIHNWGDVLGGLVSLIIFLLFIVLWWRLGPKETEEQKSLNKKIIARAMEKLIIDEKTEVAGPLFERLTEEFHSLLISAVQEPEAEARKYAESWHLSREAIDKLFSTLKMRYRDVAEDFNATCDYSPEGLEGEEGEVSWLKLKNPPGQPKWY